MRRTYGRRSPVLGLVAVLVALLVSAPSAGAVDPTDPIIKTPTVSSALYEGYTGPFVVNFDQAPIGDYAWSVSDGASDPVDSGTYAWSGSTGLEPHLMSSALTAGDYTFSITDSETRTHTATVAFTVRPGPPPKCSVVVPTTVRVGSPVVKVTARLANLCTSLHTAYAAWKISHSTQGFTDSLVFDGTTTDTWAIYDDDPMGTYLIQPKSARSAEFTEIPQNSPKVLVKRASWLSLTAARSGSFVTLSTTAARYVAAANAFLRWPSATVVLAYRNCSSCAWHQLKTLTTNQGGRASYRFQAATMRTYRASVAGTSGVWGATDYYAR